MTQGPVAAYVYSSDADLSRAVTVFLGERARARVFEDHAKVRRGLQRADDTLLVLDLRAAGASQLLEEVVTSGRNLPVIAIGEPDTDAYLDAQQAGIIALHPLPVDRRVFQQTVQNAARVLALRQENRSLQSRAAPAGISADAPDAAHRFRALSGAASPLAHWSRALRHIGNVGALMEGIVDGVAGTLLVSRAGLFARSGREGDFVFRAGTRCMESTLELRYDEDDLLARWLEENACQVARSTLEHVPDLHERNALRAELESLGAEVIVPLQGRGRLLGWLFVGNRGTGQPLTITDQEELLLIAETVSTTLENALLYEEVTLQKTMAETLLHHMPTGIIAVDTNAKVQSFNRAAASILAQREDDVLQRTVAVLGGHLADLLLRALEDEAQETPFEWTHPRSGKYLAAEARRLVNDGACLGAVAIIQDLTQKRYLEEKQDHLDRASFWNDLAASMSHEIRNPLVAIKTFAQLLPDRYKDPEFRRDFSELVTAEVDRLNRIIEQINDFAHPPELRFRALDLPQLIQNSLQAAVEKTKRNGVAFETVFEDDLPSVWGDGTALGECFAELIGNALEGVSHATSPRIRLSARRAPSANGSGHQVIVTVEDNGPGIPEEVQDKVFSPFCTSKAQGMGLGLPIARRTVMDHDGIIDLQSDKGGTRVSVGLPVARNGGARTR